MKKLYIMCGLAFSGKSTLARKIAEQTGATLISFDTLWIEKDKEKSVPKNANGWRYIRDIAQEEVLTVLKLGHSVIYDENNPRKEHREEFRKVAAEAGAEAVVVYLDTPLDVIKSRELANRTSQERHDVESENFNKVLQDLEIPTGDEDVIIYKPEMNDKDFYFQLEKL